jgi:hypothetical protein
MYKITNGRRLLLQKVESIMAEGLRIIAGDNTGPPFAGQRRRTAKELNGKRPM